MEGIQAAVAVVLLLILALGPYWLALIAEKMPAPPRPPGPMQFSVRRLMATVTIVAIGLGTILGTLNTDAVPYFLLGWFAGGVIAGAGVFLPFRHPYFGACMGFLAQVAILIAAISSI